MELVKVGFNYISLPKPVLVLIAANYKLLGIHHYTMSIYGENE